VSGDTYLKVIKMKICSFYRKKRVSISEKSYLKIGVLDVSPGVKLGSESDSQ
jgi:hypothetical protein